MKINWLATLTLTSALLLACSDDTGRPRTDGGNGDDGTAQDGPGPTKTLTFLAPETLDKKNAGKHTAIASCGSTIGIAYMRYVGDVTQTCPATFGGTPTPKPRPAHDIYYVQLDVTQWDTMTPTPVKVDQVIGEEAFGLSIAMDSSCKVYIGYLGGALSNQECRSSDAMIATSADGQSFTSQTVATAGPVGDTVGHWMSVALDSTGAVHSAYRDVHFGYYEQDGNTKASLWYDTTKISDDDGSGVYASLRYGQNDQPVILHYNATKSGVDGGLRLLYQQGGSWLAKQVVAGTTSERPRLGTDGKGLFGIAYYKPSKQAMFYTESKDLETWNEIQVDTNLTRNGEFGALAFDSRGNPAVSYHLCNDYNETSCDFTKDGVNYAYRVGTVWKVMEKVDDGGMERCGEYTALTFAPGDEPIIAYKCAEYDNQQGKAIDALRVIRGVYK